MAEYINAIIKGYVRLLPLQIILACVQTILQGSSLHVAMDGQGQLQDDFMGPIVLPNGHFACSHCSYKTDKRPNWYKHKRKHIGK